MVDRGKRREIPRSGEVPTGRAGIVIISDETNVETGDSSMTGNLTESLKTLLTEALPGLFGGDSPPPVQLILSGDAFEFDPESGDAAAGEPRPDDRVENLPFDPQHPAGPYTPTQPPYPGPRPVRLMTGSGDRIALRENEVIWNGRAFTLDLRPHRELSGVTGVEVRYSVVAVFTQIKATQTLTLRLQSADPNKLAQAEALVIAVVELNRQRLIDESGVTFVGDGTQETL
ncbi:hypothetical protein HYR99_40780, partial [Candidatus Poribacteria bacterium]|nr:hypothetical protein [Candidatus Poribacteria bacterium]